MKARYLELIEEITESFHRYCSIEVQKDFALAIKIFLMLECCSLCELENLKPCESA